MFESNCFYCDASPSQKRGQKGGNGYYIYNGIDRIDSKKGYLMNNCVPCCEWYNMGQKREAPREFFNWIKNIYLKHGDKIAKI